MTTAMQLPELAYDDVQDPAEAHRRIAEARAQSPIAMGMYGPVVLTYDLVRSVLRDERFAVPQGFSLPSQGITSGPLWDRASASLLCLEGERHHRLRRLVAKAFTPKSSARMRTACVEVVNELIDGHAESGHCEVVADICRPYPIPIICALLGAPRCDWERFSAWADDVLQLFSFDVADNAENILRSWAELDDYVDDMVVRRRDTLTDDLLSDLIRAEIDGDRLAHDDLLMLAGGLLMAGTDTTRNQLAAAIDTLCDHPDQWAMLAEDPGLAPRAVDELVRHSPIAFSVLRVAICDLELAGVPIPAGTLVIANTAAANRDPAVYDYPERLDITREDAPAILTFGGGVHYCLGTHLARVELVEALSVITARISAPRRLDRSPWKSLMGISGPTRLPIEFAAA